MTITKQLAFITGFFFLLNTTNAQDFKGLANQVCDSLKLLTISDSMIFKQIDIQQQILEGTFIELIEKHQGDIKNQLNLYNYKLIRELNRNCPENVIKHSSLLPRSGIMDFDSVFTPSQIDSLESLISELMINKKIQVFVMEIDELFPYDDLEYFSYNMLTDWRIGSQYSKGGVIIVFSKALHEIRISTTSAAQKYLNNADCHSILENIIVPNFKSGLFFKGIYDALKEIKEKI